MSQPDDTKETSQLVYQRLKEACADIESFLNEVTLSGVMKESGADEKDRPLFQDFLSSMRHLLVYGENGYEKLGICLRRSTFDQRQAKKILCWINNKCVNGFYYPKGDVYAEESRYCFTKADALQFRMPVSPRLKSFMISLLQTFEELRDELEIYDHEDKQRLQSV